MIHKAVPTIGIATLVWFATVVIAEAASRRVVSVRPIRTVVRVQDCSAFYEPYYIRGFGWGSGPGLGVSFGTFEGALPQYPSNSFPNWYGACVTWGRYSATGSAR
jgi:hypothetical protein